MNNINQHHNNIQRGKGSLWFRLMSFSALWTILALMLGGTLLSFTFRDVLEKNFDDRLNSLMENLIGISTNLNSSQGAVGFYRAVADPRFEQPYSGWYWQISAKEFNPFRSRSLWDQSLETDLNKDSSQTQYFHMTGPEEQKLRVVERDITIPGNDTVFRFTVAIDTIEIEEQAGRFDTILIYSMGALGFGLIAASFLQVFLGLRPLRNIRRSLARVRSGDEAHLPTDFPAEIQPLANEMNALLDHNNEIVERSRTQVGNLAHALKTPLAILLNEASLQKDNMPQNMKTQNIEPQNILAGQVRKQVQVMRRNVDHYLRRARVAANIKIITSRTEVLPILKDISRAMSIIHKDKDFFIDHDPDQSGLFFKGERQDLEEMVGNLMENAAKWAEKKVTIHCRAEQGQVIIEVADDGPGIEASVRDAVFARGERLDEETPGTGLGLSIVADLTRLYGGDIRLEDHKPTGLKAILRLPMA